MHPHRLALAPLPARTQSITPTANFFHSFQTFGLNAGEIAHFL